jgi:hypothetical protein
MATALMCGHRVHLIEHQQMSSFFVTRSSSGDLRRQLRALMPSSEDRLCPRRMDRAMSAASQLRWGGD